MSLPINPPGLPGEEMVRAGIDDLINNRETDFALLVLIAAPRLRALGIEIPDRHWRRPYEHALYERVEQRLGTGAHSFYNSLVRRIVSYAHALEREQGVEP